MSEASDRKFDYEEAVRKRVPLLTALIGASHSGKTWSALELATGQQRVFGGDIALIDTESNRGLHYAEYFKYRHIPFPPPHGPLDYLAVIQHARSKGASIIIVDSLAHEHSGEGGVLDQSEAYLDRKCGDDEKARERNLQVSLVKPKAQRKKLNNAIVQMGLNGIFTYRASEKVKPIGGKMVNLGWQPDTTSPLRYEMTVVFLLPPYSDGVPDLRPDNVAEAMFVKMPRQFRDWFSPGMRLSPEVGERMARWAMGADAPPAAADLEAQVTAELKRIAPGDDAEGKQNRAELMKDAFGVGTWREVKALPPARIETGLKTLRGIMSPGERDA